MIEPISFKSDDRILVTGASGWLGQTLLDLLPRGNPCLLLAGNRREQFEEWDEDLVLGFQPTVVFNFAFVTNGYSNPELQKSIAETNAVLMSRIKWMTEIPSVRSLLTVSSGSANDSSTSRKYLDYGAAKKLEEGLALSAANSRLNVIVAKAWSLSGSKVRRPKDYAFSDFILQARMGQIHVRAQGEVYRRYCSAPDFLTVSGRLLLSGMTGVVESGGELVELGALAEMIREEVNPRARVIRTLVPDVPTQIYASDNQSWETSCRAAEVKPTSLREQIRDCKSAI